MKSESAAPSRPTWLAVHRGEAPLLVSFPHTGTELPDEIEPFLVSPWLARKDTDWWVHRLYAFARDLGATTVRTRISRSVIDVNRDPLGVSLYPGMATTELCPTTTFDGEALYRGGGGPDDAEIARRRALWKKPAPRYTRGVLAKFAHNASSASTGAVLDKF